MHDAFSGELPRAYVVLAADAAQRVACDASGAHSADMRAELAAHVAGAKTKYKHLAGGVEFVDAIPKVRYFRRTGLEATTC